MELRAFMGSLAVLLLIAGCTGRYINTGAAMTVCSSNLKNISTALEMYSTDYQGSLPPSLHQLTPNYLRTLPQCELYDGEGLSSAYYPPEQAPSESETGRKIILHCRAEHPDGLRNIDGPVKPYHHLVDVEFEFHKLDAKTVNLKPADS